ncbi:CRISPR-associated protein Csx11 [Pseudothermotoga sp.]|uniref:CRISPR-associated protein Csx11 n=1 Tax=Pseudothermotoga sp. TaxID=2033661 RepID=UPI0031F617E2
MSCFDPETVRQNRPILLACEAIGWFHMVGKAHMNFLRRHGGENVSYEYEKWHEIRQPPFPWDEFLGWIKDYANNKIPKDAWPESIKEFTEKHGKKDPGLLGLLQASHGITSGIEKNLPKSTSEYLSQPLQHMWLSSPFGHPKCNLFADQPEVLTEHGWEQLVGEVRRILEELKKLASVGSQDIFSWTRWRESAIGDRSYLRRAFLSTIAETRLPNNDVTLWDQSYVAAALFKSAVAGAILNEKFPWKDGNIKQKVRWRLLTVAIGIDHYEARAVKIGDWTGMQSILEMFFKEVSRLVEVDLAIGSLLYRDSGTAIFSFPGEHFDEPSPASWLNGLEDWLQKQIENIARDLQLETPPLVRLSDPTRSLVPLVSERRTAREITAVPLYKAWDIPAQNQRESEGNICPVCQVRLNDDPTNKGKPCKVCQDRRHHRLNDWLKGQLDYNTIWFEEVADRNDRIALLTFSLDLEPWLNGERVDSLRAQAISEWARFNPELSKGPNPIRPTDLMDKLVGEIKNRLRESGKFKFDKDDSLLNSLQEGFKFVRDTNKKRDDESSEAFEERLWKTFFQSVVEDRAVAPSWGNLNDDQRAIWLSHQLFCKLPSPGRVYRFWRETYEFFETLLKKFRQIAALSDNPWRVRRLLIKPANFSDWKDCTLYNGRWRGMQLSLVYMKELGKFITASNLARLLKPEESKNVFQGAQILLEEEDAFGKSETMIVDKASEIDNYPHLSIYHPVILLELSPLRFRIIIPLEVASECVDLAILSWKELFARVWDRLPLRIGIVAFDRTSPFQAIIETVRNLEDQLHQGGETWKVEQNEKCQCSNVLQLKREDGELVLRLIPTTMPDGRKDVFYPYVAVEDQLLRHPLDFRHPNGQIYRHVSDLKLGDGVKVFPSRVSFVFADSSGTRFEPPKIFYAEDWEKVRETWKLIEKVAPSQTALQRFQSALNDLERKWRDSPEKSSSDLWRDTLRALIVEYLEIKGQALEALTEMAVKGFLQYALDWHLTVLKKSIKGG